MRILHSAVMTMSCVAVILATTSFAQAQRFGGFGGQTYSRFQLASLPEVQSQLKLTDEQKSAAKDAVTTMQEEQQSIMQNANGDFQGAQAKLAEFRTKLDGELIAKLDDAQKSRLTQIYVQAAGANALFDADVQKALDINDEQKEKLQKARDENRTAMMEAFQGFQDMSQEERIEAQAKLREDANANLLAAITEEQSKKLEELKGEKIELDLSPLRPRGFGNR